MSEITITTRPNGPLLVEGSVKLLNAAGTEIDTGGKPMIALCRCGASANKPFCDGAHKASEFKAE